MSDLSKEQVNNEMLEDESRRKFFGTSAAASLAGAGLVMGLSACKQSEEGAAGKVAGHSEGSGQFEVQPGKLDSYYCFSSAGHNGEVRIYGMPSGRTLKRIPV